MGLCIVAFLPSKALLKYLESFIRRNSQQSSISYLPFVDWCGERLRSSRVADRKMVCFGIFSKYRFELRLSNDFIRLSGAWDLSFVEFIFWMDEAKH
jgi:hypothetical protein